jgi:hypothetical protein
VRFPRAPLLAAFALACHFGSTEKPEKPDPPLGARFADDFDRAELGPAWRNTGGPYRIEDGKLVFDHAHNHPLWLARRLPRDVRIELDAMARTPDGDLKVEVFGDGHRHESEEAVRKDLIYEASGYVFIFGGWHNARSVLVRKNEHTWQHDRSVPLRTTPRVEPGRTYHWVITRRGGHIDWQIDGKPFLAWDDPHPLEGEGQDHFAFDGWESTCVFDNLVITAL